MSCLKHLTDGLSFQMRRTFHEAHKQLRAHRLASLAFYFEYFCYILPTKL